MKRRCAAAALLILCVFLTCGAGLAPERLIVVDADVQRVYFYREGELIRSWPCAVGKTATPSPLGVFRINVVRHLQQEMSCNTENSDS